MGAPLKDQFQREITYLRISVTDRCNLRCQYCMPAEGVAARPRPELLTYEELLRLGRIFAGLGFVKFRFTGGEPLVRRDLVPFLGEFAQISGVKDLALSTNAVLLAEHAKAMADAGVQRLNISLDTLNRSTFEKLQRRDELKRTLDGIEAAHAADFSCIKINAVVMRGINDHELQDLAQFTLDRGMIIRFIEFMPTAKHGAWNMERVVPIDEMITRLKKRWPDLTHVGDPGGTTGPARRWTFAEGKGEMGFISAVSDTFCTACNRVRLTSDGNLRGCLFADGQRSLRDVMRDGASDDEIAEVIRKLVWNKVESHRIGQADFEPISLGMSEIGG